MIMPIGTLALEWLFLLHLYRNKIFLAGLNEPEFWIPLMHGDLSFDSHNSDRVRCSTAGSCWDVWDGVWTGRSGRRLADDDLLGPCFHGEGRDRPLYTIGTAGDAGSPHFRRKAEAGRAPVHEWRAFAGRHLRPQAAARRSTTASRCRARTSAPSARPAPPWVRRFAFKQVRPERHRGQRAFRPHGRAHIDDMCIIRSMYADVPNHEPSLMLMNCGDGRLQRPSMGSWITYGLGSENQNLPGFIAMCPGGYPIVATQNWRSAFLPGAYQGTYIDTQHTDIDKLIENIRNDGSDPDRAAATARPGARAQRSAMPQLGRTTTRSRRGSSRSSWPTACRARRRKRLTSIASPTPIRELYGTGHRRPASCLITRRLLERGVRFIQVWSGAGQPWDDHDNLEVAPSPARRRLGPGHRRFPDRSETARAVRTSAGDLGRRVRPHARRRTAGPVGPRP